MARKLGFGALGLYVVYGLLVYWYLFHFADTSLPFEYQGTQADPTTFLNGREIMLSEEFSKIRNLLFFLSTPLEWLIYLLILVMGASRAFKRWAEESAKKRIVQMAIYLFWLVLFAYLATFPLSYISYSLSKTYGISTQTFAGWMKDELIDFWVNYLYMFVIFSVLYWLMSKSQKRWWLYAWFLSIPFTFFTMFLQPVVIDPLYNDFYPLKDKQLEAQILELASRAKIPANHVFEVNKSEETNALNAYVTGIGSNSRIVLWDTTLNKLEDDQILFIMAHEMSHYVNKDIYINIGVYLTMSLFGLYFINRLMKWSIGRWGEGLKLERQADIQSFPLFLMVLSMLLFAASPLSNFISRLQETRADRYAIEMTGNTQAAITSFQILSKAGLTQVNPPLLVKIFRYEHPTMLERISRLEEYEIKQQKSE